MISLRKLYLRGLFGAFALNMPLLFSMASKEQIKQALDTKKYQRIKHSYILSMSHEQLTNYIKKSRWTNFSCNELEAIGWHRKNIKAPADTAKTDFLGNMSPRTILTWSPALVTNFVQSKDPKTITQDQWDAIGQVLDS